MSPVITIDDVGPGRSYESKFGTLTAYLLQFSGGAVGEGEISQRPDRDPPAVGETLDVDVLPPVREGLPARLKRVKVEGAGGASNAKGSSYGKSPQERAEIVRMAAQKAALHLLEIEVALGIKLPEGVKVSELLKPRIQWFVDDAKEAAEGSS